jgi:hypothetical protein
MNRHGRGFEPPIYAHRQNRAGSVDARIKPGHDDLRLRVPPSQRTRAQDSRFREDDGKLFAIYAITAITLLTR